MPDLDRCPPDTALDDVTTEQYCYLLAACQTGGATPAERSRYIRVRAILLEPFDEAGLPAMGKAA